MDESTIIKTEHENKGKSYLCAGMACERICGHRRYISSLDYPALRQGGGATIMYPAASRMGTELSCFSLAPCSYRVCSAGLYQYRGVALPFSGLGYEVEAGTSRLEASSTGDMRLGMASCFFLDLEDGSQCFSCVFFIGVFV